MKNVLKLNAVPQGNLVPSGEPVTGERKRVFGFRPAFFDIATCAIHLARHADGRLAASHVLDGLPEEAVVVRTNCGRVIAAKATLVPGFERGGFFYTRRAAAKACVQWR